MKLSTLLSPFVFVLAAKAAFGQSDPCLASASDARDSCRLSAQSGYSLALATCANESDPAKQATCRQNAQTALQDALAVCDAEFSARQTICGFLGGRGWDPEINPADFSTSTTIDNPYYPLKPGTTFVYQAHNAAGGLIENRVAVTHKTKTILGVTCVEVHDTVSVNGQLTEDT